MQKAYAVVGSWNFRASEKGFGVYDYDIPTGTFTLLKLYDPSVSAGQQCFDPKRNILYIVDECEGRPSAAGVGGFVRAYAFNPNDGSLQFINEQCVYMTKPAYMCLDKSGEYALVAAHTGRGYVTKVARNADGTIGSRVLYEDVGIALLKVNHNGSLGEVCDVVLYDGLSLNPLQVHAHPHSIVPSPSGELFIACDKGLDKIYTYKLDRQNGKLISLAEKSMPYASAPRYSVFHPFLPVWYENNETSNDLYVFRYDETTGELDEIEHVPLCEDLSGKISPSDIAVSHDGKYLYASVRGANVIVVFGINPVTGALERLQMIRCVGEPRGLCISPDGRFLFSADNDISSVHQFSIADDGSLSDTGILYDAVYASNINILVFSGAAKD